MSSSWTELVLFAIVGLPALAILALALPAWFGWRLGERFVVAVLGTGCTLSAGACLISIGVLAASGESSLTVDLGPWFQVEHYRFELFLIGDRLSLPFAAFAATLVGLVAAFSRRYLHLEPGFLRFFLLLAVFGTAVQLVVLAGTLDLVFFGWELVGVTSALLIGFFHERPGPVQNGLRAFKTYRACDVGLLGAAVWLHYTVGSTALVDGRPWAQLATPATTAGVTTVGLLLLWASIGKSGQVPLGGWLPRAMEGPTNSSAIFYGALSIHLGPYLLLRSGAILEAAPAVAWAVAAVGAVTALHGTYVGRAQTDIKSALAYASMTQVGLILVEIGAGFQVVALIHVIGHAALRSLQILRCPSLLHDHHHLEQAMGRQLPRTGRHLERFVPRALQPWLYRLALERGYLDTLVCDHLLGGFRRGVLRIDSADRWLSNRIAGAALDGETRPEEDVR